MSHYPPHGGPPPPYYPMPHWPPPPHHPPPHHPPQHPPPPHQPPSCIYPPPPDGGQVTAPQPYPYFVGGIMMTPVPVAPVVPPMETPASQPTYITNYIYHGESSNNSGAPAIEPPKIAELSGDHDWVPTTTTTAAYLTGQAVVGGHEGWDGSPLWVIRAWHNGDLIPGKFSIRHTSASVMYDGKEIPVQNIEVLISKPDRLRWIPASNGNVPPGAIEGGRTASGEALYVGRARHQLSITPGKVHPSHNSCYIAFGGLEVAHKMYDVLCRI